MRKKNDKATNVAGGLEKLSLPALVSSSGIRLRPAMVTFIAFLISATAAFSGRRLTPQIFWGQFLVFLLLYAFFVILYGKRITGRPLVDAEIYLLSALTTFYYICAAIVRDYRPAGGFMPVSVMLPTALVVMLASILIDPRLARVMALLLPQGALIAESLNGYGYIFALASGIAATLVLQNARKRMDMVKSGLLVALVNVIAVTGILLVRSCRLALYPNILFWAAVNGLAAGMLVLGVLPILENALKMATTLKLIELADLDSPILRKLASTCPGTYQHSLQVANLAEAACREIGANSLLARVGAYYHDIGKIDNPSYFVENQSAYNKHDEIKARLSATVIRSHVKLGIEKARSLGLPNEVIEIIASHHGNSLIAYFYNEALKEEGQVDPVDFSYPGHPPYTREAAVVMLADVVEAAVRTLDKPSAASLEKFMQELITKKVESDQLAESELTFHNLEVIKKTFLRVMISYYHSRIEYPAAPLVK
jgi:putative nucleotidyltransferase with HDIG domain